MNVTINPKAVKTLRLIKDIVFLITIVVLGYYLQATVQQAETWQEAVVEKTEEIKKTVNEVNEEIEDVNEKIEALKNRQEAMYWSGIYDMCMNGSLLRGESLSTAVPKCQNMVTSLQQSPMFQTPGLHNQRIPQVAPRQIRPKISPDNNNI